MGMYESRPVLVDPRDLNQGDLVSNVFRVHPPAEAGLVPVRSRQKIEFTNRHDAVRRRDPDLRAVCRVEPVLAVVLSNSCDNARGLPLMFGPVIAFPAAPNAAPADLWNKISAMATGTASPKFFYLPASPSHGVLERSCAVLSDLFVVSQDYIKTCVDHAGATCLGGLAPEAQRHLQWGIGVFFGRDPREDDAWPSLEDWKLKLAWHEAEIESGGPQHEWHKQERVRVLALIAALVSQGSSAGAPPTSTESGP